MADRDIEALFADARQALPHDDFAADVDRAIERWERSRRLLSWAQGAAALVVLTLLSLQASDLVLPWLSARVEQLTGSSWWLAGVIVCVSLVLLPRPIQMAKT